MHYPLNKASQIGFTLIEILVSVLVLGIGILGFAALQLSSTGSNLDAYMRLQATAIAEDLISRMTANRFYVNWDMRAPATGTPGTDNIYVTAVPATGYACTGTAPRQCIGSDAGNVCDEQQIATSDVWQICRSANTLLPGGLVHVTCRDKPAVTINAVVNPRGNAFPTNHKYFEEDNGGVTLLTGADADTCSPGSRYSIHVSWLKAAAQTGTGAFDLASARCTAIGLANDRDCVAIDVVP